MIPPKMQATMVNPVAPEYRQKSGVHRGQGDEDRHRTQGRSKNSQSQVAVGLPVGPEPARQCDQPRQLGKTDNVKLTRVASVSGGVR